MKKRRKIKPHKENIFLFPNVDKLLMEKGLESLQNKKFSEAIEYLEKAKELDQYNEDIDLGLIISYFESGNLLTAKNIANESLQKGVGDYFQLIDIFIMILLQLNEYEEIVSTIEALIEEKEVPIDKLDNFSKILEFSRRKLESDFRDSVEPPDEESEKFDLFHYQNINDQFLAIEKISEKNVRSYLKGIKEYLQSEHGHPFIKTMLLQLLKEQEVNQEIEIHKFQQSILVNPTDLLDLENSGENTNIIEKLKQVLEQSNPTLFDSSKTIVSRHSFLLFPIERNPSDPSIWTAAYHFITLEYFGEIVSIEEMAEKYQINQRDLKEVIAFIRELEEISSPFI
ncbi:tetratricopeptide repeat protein [Bacillus sp. CGMCC 1.16607]|uniref:tetratricopeptide repeat protein n=1 Tax=Bacillus sp. CGMCC 1.16607 TaxID=3351842 RepID=UPI0036351486